MNLSWLPSLPEDFKIIDIGSGHQPFKGATTLVDFYPNPEDDDQRGGPCVQDERLLIADICAGLPFPDKHFDFAICAETLNHVADPNKACQEIVRIAKAGYIEIPDLVHEIFEPHTDHLWRCWLDDEKVIHFSPKREGDVLFEAEAKIGWATCFSNLPLRSAYKRFINRYQREIYIVLQWQNTFQWQVHV